MANLNKLWITLIIVGVLLILTIFGVSIYESVFTAGQEFTVTINEFDKTTLVDSSIEEHLSV